MTVGDGVLEAEGAVDGRAGGARRAPRRRDGWVRFRLAGRRWVHAWPASDRRLLEALSAALAASHDAARPARCAAPVDDLVVLAADEPGAAVLLQQLRGLDATRLLPIVLFDPGETAGRLLALADGVLPAGPASTLQALLAQESTLERLEALPSPDELSAGERRELDLVRYLHLRDVAEIVPVADPESPIGFRYPLPEALLGRSPLETVQTLEELRSLGLLQAEPVERIYLCASCHSSRLSIREICPSCRVPSLAAQSVIHHFRCAHVAAVGAFQRSGRLVCPKCEETLLHVGVDHDRPGLEQRCQRCEGSWHEGIVEALCLACDARSAPEHQRLLDLPAFRPRPALARAAARPVPPLTTASDLLRSLVLPTDPAIYRLLRERTEAVCRRYGRPATLLRVHVDGLPELQERVGRRELRRRAVAFVHALRQLLRSTDIVGLDDDGSIEVVLVETDAAGARVVCRRLEESLASTTGAPLDVTLSVEPLPAAEAS